jgi:hypothetical protein
VCEQLHAVDSVEDSIVAAFMALVLRLSEPQLKAFFLKTVEWLGPPPLLMIENAKAGSKSADDKDGDGEGEGEGEGSGGSGSESDPDSSDEKKTAGAGKGQKRKAEDSASAAVAGVNSGGGSNNVDRAIIFFKLVNQLIKTLQVCLWLSVPHRLLFASLLMC